MHESDKNTACNSFFGALSSFFCLFSAFLQLTCAEEINSAAPNLKKKKEEK